MSVKRPPATRKKSARSLILPALAATALAVASFLLLQPAQIATPEFSGPRAFQLVAKQLTFGPRTPGSTAHSLQLDWMQSELETLGWQVERQHGEMLGHPLTNLVAKRGSGGAFLMLGAHYDSRIHADQDPDPAKRAQPVPGANDGASGVAVLLELARVLPADLDLEIWIVFFDLEDNGGIPGWDWILGSRYFAQNLDRHPDQFILVDLVGDRDLSLPIERNSDDALANELWSVAEDLGYGAIFSRVERFSIIDDHIPFIELGIPSVNIIDIEYTNWHTTQDDISQVSAESLEIVGSTVLEWILRSYQ